MPEQTADRLERWFLRRGIPHFIDRYNASQDVFTRALPILVLVFLVEVLGAGKLGWPWWANRLAELGGLVLLIAAWGAVNRVRGRRALAPPERVGPTELAVFVLVPALLPIVFGGEVGDAGWTLAANLTILGAVYVITSYGLVPMTRWAAGRLIVQLGDTLRLFTRGLPLLLVAFTFLFINAEVWEVAGTLDWARLGTILGLFGLLGAGFMISRLPRELGPLARFERREDVEPLLAGSPAEGLPVPDPSATPDPTVRQWGNAGLVVLFTQGLRVAFAAALIGGFFVAFGTLAMDPATVASWIGADPQVLATIGFFGSEMVVTAEVIRVSAFLAGFAGLYFSVYLATDPTFREEFFEDVRTELRESFAVRVVYLDLVGAAPAREAASVEVGG
jgi:hypothetical protein